MPVYTYECNICGTQFEVARIKIGDAEPILFCPECESDQPVTRLISGCNFKLGWVTTPYTPKGSRQLKVREINGQFYDVESYNAKRLSKVLGKRIRPRKYREMKKAGRLPKGFKEVE